MKAIQSIPLLAVIIATLYVAPTTQQAPPPAGNKCLEDFGNALMGCVKDGGQGITIENFMWFVTNGSSARSQAPANPEAFKTQICGAQQAIGACTFQRVGAIINSTACVGTSPSTSQQAAISNQLTSVFGTYDLKCMHPCRMSLANDLRSCYTDNGLDSKNFLSNSSNGAVIGSTQDQVTKFCAAKDTLISCMNGKITACPEAPGILRAIDLDIPSFQKGIQVLCKSQSIYLTGLSCFAETTPDIDRCKQKETQSYIEMDTQARAGNWSEQRFYQEYCPIAVTQIECDLSAWAKKAHEACTPTVVGLRRELECQLIPSQCNVDPKQISQVDHACHPEKFSTETRGGYGSSAESVVINCGLVLASFVLSRSVLQ